jgi:HEAT repeat protein
MRTSVLWAWVVCLCCCVAGSASAGAGEKVQQLIADLKNPQKTKVDVVIALGELKDKAAPAVPELIAVLQTKDEYLRLQTAIALGNIGKAAVTPLAKAVADPDADVRFYAVWALAFIGSDAKSASSAVVKALGDKSADVRRKAAYALMRIDPDPAEVIDPLAIALGDGNDDVRNAAAKALAKLGEPAATALLKLFKTNDDPKVRILVVKTLGDIGPAAKAAIPQLKAFLLDPTKGATQTAAEALAGIGEPAIAALMEGAKGENAETRSFAVQALKKIGVPAVPHLIDLLGAKHTDVRRAVAAQLGFMDVQDKSIVIALGFSLKDADQQVRLNSLNSLRKLGSGAKLAEKYVIEVLTDSDAQVRQEAFYTLQTLGVDPKPGLKQALSHKDVAVRVKTATLMLDLNLEPALAEPILRDALKGDNADLKTQAAYSLAKKGLGADVVVPIFLDGLKNPTASVRSQSAKALALYSNAPANAGKISSALLAALDDTDDIVRAEALATLNLFGGEPKFVLPAMVKLLQKDASLQKPAAKLFTSVGVQSVPEVVSILKATDNAAVRLACIQTLSTVGPPAKDATAELIKALDDPTARVRLLAARALGNIGPAAKDAVPALEKAEKDSDGNVQKIAAAALAQIRADPNQVGLMAQGVLTSDDPMDPVRGGSHQVVHMFQMKAGKTYTIDLKSTWDNFLRLENAQGKQLAQDDDSGGFPNARIVFNAPADGYYRIIVTSFAPGATGPYTLTVK